MVGTAPDPNSCIAYWKFEDLTDSSGNSATLTNSGATFVTGVLGNCASFNGTSDYMLASNIPTLSGNKSFTFWYKTSTSLTNRYFFDSTDGSDRLILGWNNDNYAIYDGTAYRELTSTVVKDDSWTHMAYVLSDTGTTITIYVDGVSLGSTSCTNRPLDSTPAIGSQNGGGGTYFPGEIDEFAIFDNSLSANNVSFIYNGGSPTSLQQFPFPVAPDPNDCNTYCKLESDATDSTSNSNDGTLTGVTFPTTGIIDSCAGFNGTSDSIAFSSGLSTSAGTVSLWFNSTAINTNFHFIFNHYNSGNRIMIFQDDDFVSARLGSTAQCAGKTIAADTWYHAMLTWDGSTGDFYIDGTSVDSWSYTGLSSISTRFGLGAFVYSGPESLWYDGKIDEVAFFDTTLTANNAAYLYQGGSPTSDQQFPFPVAPDSDDCISYFKFEDNADDATGLNDGTNVGVTFETGMIDKCGIFDGVNDSFDIPFNSNFNFAYDDSFTLGAWAKSSDLTKTFNSIISRQDWNSPFNGWALTFTNAQTLRLFRWQSTSARYTLDSDSTTFSEDTWYHVGAVWNASTTTGTLYVDGSAITGTIVHNTLGTADMTDPTNGFRIGRRPNAGDSASAFVGNIDEAFIFNVALTSNNFAYIYNSGSPTSAQQYPFEAPSTSTVKVLVVGGGGGTAPGTGFGAVGGGGAGGFQYNSALGVTSQAYTVTVGAGGIGYNNGSSSTFSTITSIGGGAGGEIGRGDVGQAGGSGGGGAGYTGNGDNSGGAGTTGQGFAGGAGVPATDYLAGGGGGASEVGSDATSTVSGDGGDGIANSISGSSVYYAGGGGGGGWNNTYTGGNGGLGGGGDAANAKGTAGNNGSANTGGGAGGSSNDYTTGGANGGSGIVIISYATDGSDGVTTSSTGGTITTSGDQTIHTFTADGTFTAVTGDAPSTLLNGIVSFWKFDDDAVDSLGNNNGTNNGGTYVSGKINNCISMNGTSNYVALPDNSDFDYTLSSTFAHSYWVKSSTVSNIGLFGKRNFTSGAGVLTYINSSAAVTLIAGSSGTNKNMWTSTISVTADEWTNVIVSVRDLTSTTGVDFYFDGVKETTITNPDFDSGADITTSDVPALGKSSVENDTLYYNGLLDAVGAWDRPLTDAEAVELTNGGDGIQYPFGAEPSTGWTGKVLGVTNPAKVLGVEVANIAKVNGVASSGGTSSTLLDDLLWFGNFDGDVTDETGNFTPTNYGTTSDTTNKKLGTASRLFDGTSDYIDMELDPSTEIGAGDWTAYGWFRADSGSLTSSAKRCIFCLGNISATFSDIMAIRWDASNGLIFNSRLGVSGYASIVYSGTISEETWYLMIGKRVGTTMSLSIDDGSYQTLTDAEAGVSAYDGAYLGDTTHSASNERWKGNLDAFGLMNRDITAAEKTEIWNSGDGVQYPFT